MANSSTKRARPVRTLVVFAILSMLLPFAAVILGTYLDPHSEENPSGASFAPGLALDLQGGTQIILTPVTTDGSEVTSETIEEAINVIRQRIDSSGVAEAEITSQGGNNIVVGIPGEVSDETIDLIARPAQMRFRPVLTYEFGLGGIAVDGAEDEDGDDAETPSQDFTELDERIEAEAADVDPVDASDPAQITPAVQEKFDALDCSDPANLVGGGRDNPDVVLVTCADDGTLKYILGPMEVAGTHIDSASSGLVPGPQGSTTNIWGVFLEFDAEGTAEFREVTTRLQGLESPRNQFGIVLDGLVISAPSLDTGVIITDGRPQISGNFTQATAATLANQLAFGALPIAFDVQSEETISATLGSEQLRNGIIAGLIGMALVVVYALVQYRMLGLLAIATLVVAGVLTYLAITLLSWGIGYRLSLAGVAGLIVAIGVTADSFIVYFERIRDELRDGRSLSFAVERGWHRAKRTILAAKAVNLMSAIILYNIAVGGVQGFAFTLGLTTLIDLLVVFTFTNPVMQLLAKRRFFRDGHKLSGLDPERFQVSGVRYTGAGTFSTPRVPDAETAQAPEPALAGASAGRRGATSAAPAVDESGRRLTIAERRAAERRAAAAQAEDDGPPDDVSRRIDDAITGQNGEDR